MTFVHPSADFRSAINPLVQQIATSIQMPAGQVAEVLCSAGINLTPKNVERVAQTFKLVLAASRPGRQP